MDYEYRQRLLAQVACPAADLSGLAAELLAARADGRIKMYVTTRALAVRHRLRHAFAGDYVPLGTKGVRHSSLFAYARRHGSEYAVTCVPRLLASVIPALPGSGSGGVPLPIGPVWLDTRVALPAGAPTAFHDAFTGAGVVAGGANGDDRSIPAATLFERFPIALLVAD